MPSTTSVTVIGLGYVGLPTAALLARAGYRVRGVDVSERVIAALSSGRCPLGEAEVASVVEEALVSGRLTASTEPEPADVFIICVPTPVRRGDDGEHRADLSMVDSAMDALLPAVKEGALIILESTSPIGTTRNLIGTKLAAAGLDPKNSVDVCYCPERVFPGATVSEILKNDRIVGGLTPHAAERAREFYETFCDGTPVTTSAEAAEYSKLMENAFRDVNIALANSFACVAEKVGVDVADVITLANRHPRVNVHQPGPGVGGHCIPVDPWFLIEAAPEETELLRLSRSINDMQAERLLNRAEDAGLRRGGRVAILGAAYRADLDDAREAPTEQLLAVLDERGYEAIVHDPHVTAVRGPRGQVTPLRDLSEAIVGAEAVFLMTGHAGYRGLAPVSLAGMTGRIIADGRGVLHRQSFLDGGFTFVPVGGPTEGSTRVAGHIRVAS